MNRQEQIAHMAAVIHAAGHRTIEESVDSAEGIYEAVRRRAAEPGRHDDRAGSHRETPRDFTDFAPHPGPGCTCVDCTGRRPSRIGIVYDPVPFGDC